MYDTTKPYKQQIQEIIRSTWNLHPHIQITPGDYPTFRTQLLGYDYEIDHTDGVGTKGKIHWQNHSFAALAQDAFAMNWNDLQTVRAKPFKLQNHLMVPEDDHEAILDILRVLAHLCLEYGVVMTGGETSIHNNLDGCELSVTMTGCTEAPVYNQFLPGQTVIGLHSSGLHSNGWTRALQFSSELTQFDLTTPTIIYELRHLWNAVEGMVHLAGGGYTRLKSVLGDSLLIDADLELETSSQVPEIFHKLHQLGIPLEEMYKTFNCGFGMVLAVKERKVEYVLKQTGGVVLGKVVPGTGKVRIKSWIGEGLVEY